MVFRDNIVYKNDNTSKVKGKVELTKENVYVTIKTMKFFNKACI